MCTRTIVTFASVLLMTACMTDTTGEPCSDSADRALCSGDSDAENVPIETDPDDTATGENETDSAPTVYINENLPDQIEEIHLENGTIVFDLGDSVTSAGILGDTQGNLYINTADGVLTKTTNEEDSWQWIAFPEYEWPDNRFRVQAFIEDKAVATNLAGTVAVYDHGEVRLLAENGSICTNGVNLEEQYGSKSNSYKGFWGTSETHLFALCTMGAVLHFDGVSWTQVAELSSYTPKEMCGISANDYYLSADIDDEEYVVENRILHFRDDAVEITEFEGDEPYLGDITCTSDGDLYFLQGGTVKRLSNGDITVWENSPVMGEFVNDFVMYDLDHGNIYFDTTEMFSPVTVGGAHFDGTSWKQLEFDINVNSLWISPEGQAYGLLFDAPVD